ncbi:putative monovalent cation/H+ antiporter subunit E [Bartonella australis AUST/NH1]|uniref:Putative monovalent cation/H+ antiporter subunit E n=1 Tax=Bartonella australis (strain Aust/NH1) TaxID=1094489 RepID=M1NV22_BARAA|nr:Na+/H+ antiporter subunit E [Bartonella australis]AGF75133.1 putative monovalent cation/H+ antiporter subunit E [Bartonella australis AUST/NH1]
MNRFFPYPFLSGLIALMWLILNNFSLGQLLLGIIVALFCGWVTQFIQPEKRAVKNWNIVFKLIFRVFFDSISANISVAWFTLTKRYKGQHSGFIVVPLLLESRTALAILACILSASPGIIWVTYNSKNNKLLIHVLNLKDGNDYRQLIKQRYEKLLLEIFS